MEGSGGSLVESSMVSSHASVASPGSESVGDRLYEAAVEQRYRREEMIRAREAEYPTTPEPEDTDNDDDASSDGLVVED